MKTILFGLSYIEFGSIFTIQFSGPKESGVVFVFFSGERRCAVIYLLINNPQPPSFPPSTNDIYVRHSGIKMSLCQGLLYNSSFQDLYKLPLGKCNGAFLFLYFPLSPEFPANIKAKELGDFSSCNINVRPAIRNNNQLTSHAATKRNTVVLVS